MQETKFQPPPDAEAERQDARARFDQELAKVTANGSKRRQQGVKPPWYDDPDHERAIFSHLTKWKAGATQDPDSGAHPLVHVAWRALAIACQESGNVPAGATMTTARRSAVAMIRFGCDEIKSGIRALESHPYTGFRIMQDSKGGNRL